MGQHHVELKIDENNMVTEVGQSYTETIDGVSYDKCVICGKTSPYTTATNIYNRVGYVEGAGQGCFQPNSCVKTTNQSSRELITIPKDWILGTPNDQELGEKVRAYYWENYG